MARAWQLRDARDKFSEVVEEALRHGSQVITRRGRETAILLSHEDYRRLLLGQAKLSDFFRAPPLAGVDLDLTRDSSPNRHDTTL